MKLWLDDERPAPEGWYWVKTGAAAIACLLDQGDDPITHMSFDHDLADVHYEYWHLGHNPAWSVPKDHPVRAEARERAAKERTGYDVLLWMAEHNIWPTEACYVHSHNSVGAERMVGVINRYGPYSEKCRWTPFTPDLEPNR